MLHETVTIQVADDRYLQVTWQRDSSEPGTVEITTSDPDSASLDGEGITHLIGALERARREALDPPPHPGGWVAGDGVTPLQLDQDEHVVQAGPSGQWVCVRSEHATHPCITEGVDLDAATAPVRFAALVGDTGPLPQRPTE